MPVAARDVAWAAGFLEGEGWFGSYRVTPIAKACQKEEEPLLRVRSIFGGNLILAPRRDRGVPRAYYEWSVCGDRAAAVMMTLFVLMTSRRQAAIAKALVGWKTIRQRHHAMRIWGMCPEAGSRHTISYVTTTGKPYCLQCRAVQKAAGGVPSQAKLI